MLTKTEMEILCSALYISLNFKKFKNYISKNNPSLYNKIYSSDDLLTIEQIKEIININGLKIIDEIRNAEIKLSQTEKKGNIGTIDNHIKWMISHYNAIKTPDSEIQEESWRK